MSGAGGWGGGGRISPRRFYDSAELSSRSAGSYSSPAARQVPEVQGKPGNQGLRGPVDPGVGSRKQVPLCNLQRHPSLPAHPPSEYRHTHTSLVLTCQVFAWLGCTIRHFFKNPLLL